MYCEQLLMTAAEGDRNSLEEFFYANYGLLYSFAKTFKVAPYEEEDFFQLCFVAIVQAVEVWKPSSSHSFLSFYRMCVKHQFFMWKAEMRYPVKIPFSEYKSVEENGFDYQRFNQSADSNLNLERIEQSVTSEKVWDEVEKVVGSKNREFLYARFVERIPFNQLMELAGMKGQNSVKLRVKQNALFKKLRKSKELQAIASDCFGIKTERN